MDGTRVRRDVLVGEGDAWLWGLGGWGGGLGRVGFLLLVGGEYLVGLGGAALFVGFLLWFALGLHFYLLLYKLLIYKFVDKLLKFIYNKFNKCKLSLTFKLAFHQFQSQPYQSP